MKYPSIIEHLKKKGSVLGLDPIRNLLAELGNPQDDIKILHIAGTNGKGSIFAYLASILQKNGARVGRYISPTIQCYEERFQINGVYITPESLERYYQMIQSAIESMEQKGLVTPTLFEVETAISFLYFREEKVDYALIEVGMGGLLDATNVISSPAVTVIASISYDHMAFLGDTLEEIATQKAGIIKTGVPVVVSENEPEVCKVITEIAKEKGSPCIFVKHRENGAEYVITKERIDGSSFLWEDTEFVTPLPGAFQVQNAVTALKVAELLGISHEVMREGLLVTRWPGRLEKISDRPLCFRDGAHNPDAAKKLAQFLGKHFGKKQVTFMLGVLKDKDYPQMLRTLMPLARKVYVFTPQNERGLDARVLAETIRRIEEEQDLTEQIGTRQEAQCLTDEIEKAQQGQCPEAAGERPRMAICMAKDVREAYQMAISQAEPEDILVLCGSLSFMEEQEVSEAIE